MGLEAAPRSADADFNGTWSDHEVTDTRALVDAQRAFEDFLRAEEGEED